MLGSTCSQVVANGPLPATRAASTKSRAQTLRAAVREMRAKTGTLKKPIATIAVTRPGPQTAVSRIADNSAGKANAKSDARITSSSTQPRRAAASNPSATPEDAADADRDHADRDRIAAAGDQQRKPRRGRARRCRGQWAREGGASLWGMSSSVGGQGVQTNDSSAVATSSPTSTAPATKLLCRPARRSQRRGAVMSGGDATADRSAPPARRPRR